MTSDDDGNAFGVDGDRGVVMVIMVVIVIIVMMMVIIICLASAATLFRSWQWLIAAPRYN
jgi:hypothetical protein